MNFSFIFSNIIYHINNFFEKRKYGSNHSECFSLDFTLTKLILPRLKRYRHYVLDYGTYPYDLESIEEWLSIIDEIIAGFELLLIDDLTEDSNEKINKSLQLFSEYYQDFWI